MKQHPIIGDDLCRTVRSLEAVRPIVRHHHERLDGRGYPGRADGRRRSRCSRAIVGVVDVFDALTTDRPYRKAMNVDAALHLMRTDARAGWCDPSLVEAFVDVLPAKLHKSVA